jgi:chaperonin GroEL
MSSKELEKTAVSRDEVIGYEIVKTALEAPFKQLIRNAGMDPGLLLAKAREKSAKGFGYNVLKITSIEDAVPVNMIKEGIVDPLKVVRTAVQNSVSVANMILTTEALITDLPEKKEPAMPAMPGGMGGMGGGMGMDY